MPDATEYSISSDPTRLDIPAIHAFLTGFARAITDRATFAYFAEVFVLDAHRGHGLGTQLIKAMLAHPDLQGLRRIMLVTRDAQDLYARCGFAPPDEPSGIMQIRWRNRYAR